MINPSVLIFANPIAGRGRGKIVARRLEQHLLSAGYTVQTILEKPANAKLSTASSSAIAAIAIGGDGTLRGVVEFLCADGAEPPPLLPVPMGTANLMGRHLGVRWSSRNLGPAILETLRRRQIVRLDAARANGRIFLLMAGIGIDAQVVHLLDHMRRGPIAFTSYVLPAALTLANYQFPPISVTIDGRAVTKNIPAVAFIGNVKEYGAGFPILTRARPDDGLLDICVIPCDDRRQLLEILMLIATGEHPLREGVVYVQGKSVLVEAKKSVPVQVDGDSAGHTPLQIDLLSTRIPFLIPAR